MWAIGCLLQVDLENIDCVTMAPYQFILSLQCPETLQNSVKRNMDDYEDYNNPTETPTEKSLIRLHKNVIKASQHYRRTHCQWNMLLEKAFDLEDIALNEVSAQRKYVRSFGKYEGVLQKCYNPTVGKYRWLRLLMISDIFHAVFPMFCQQLPDISVKCEVLVFEFLIHFLHTSNIDIFLYFPPFIELTLSALSVVLR